MEKRYQVFISSTYSDLIEERAEVIQALLELDCMPAGMELFPAASEEQWKWIKKVIDESDHYIVIVAGRYGSISKNTNLSYTEMEYRYAIEKNKPIIAFLHENPSSLSSSKCENNPDSREKLDAFRSLLQGRLCKFWSNASDLGSKVSRSIVQLLKRHPAIGWVRSDVINIDNATETLKLRRKIEELEQELSVARIKAPEGTENLAHGQDIFSIDFSFERKQKKIGRNDQAYWVKYSQEYSQLESCWDDIFCYIAPMLIQETPEAWIVSKLNNFILSRIILSLEELYPDEKFDNFQIYGESYRVIIIQLRALNLIMSTGKRSEWILTPYGDNYMTRILAVRKLDSDIKK